MKKITEIGIGDIVEFVHDVQTGGGLVSLTYRVWVNGLSGSAIMGDYFYARTDETIKDWKYNPHNVWFSQCDMTNIKIWERVV